MTHPSLSIDTCKRCLGIIKSIESCPSWDIVQNGEFIAAFGQIIWFLASMSFPIVLLVIVLYSLFRKSTRGFYLLLNVGIQQMIIFFVKKIVNQPRPLEACTTSSGFPSGHAAFASGIDTWFILEIIFFSKEALFRKSKLGAYSRNIFMVLSPLVPASRYFLKYHTLVQILAGTGVGIVSSILFFGICFRFKDKDYEPLRPKFIKLLARYRLYKPEDMRVKPEIAPQQQDQDSAQQPIEILGA